MLCHMMWFTLPHHARVTCKRAPGTCSAQFPSPPSFPLALKTVRDFSFLYHVLFLRVLDQCDSGKTCPRNRSALSDNMMLNTDMESAAHNEPGRIESQRKRI